MQLQDFNGVWTRDLAIPVRCSYQLSYEATDVGSRSIVGSYVPVKEINVNDVYERNQMKDDSRRCERNLCKEAWKKKKKKIRTSQGLNPWPRDTGGML